MRLKRFIRKTFTQGNVCVTGLRGTGKDMLFANVIARRKKPYISNCDYHCKRSPYIPLKFNKLDVKNNYKNLIEDNIISYDYPYPEACDIYVTDASVYFPSQDFLDLNRKYPNMVNFQALSRHLGNCNFHINAQNLNRLWDKIREQSDIYIRCERCIVLPRLLFRRRSPWVLQIVTVYDKYESCVNRVKPFRPLPVPLFNKAGTRNTIKADNERYKREFDERNGSVKRYFLVYRNKTQYDTRLFKKLFGGKNERLENED